ncbi:hypothetical protein BRE01_12810 [Brevibacillus reuszeri]|uniref:Uncharacterized protein n=1 Tax=Brevibacillus reuszeri TaxID=54915 RepID=A0A0K9YT83_9BACL|nr:hypothetical protein [Brevibacillus reuszeri]KNB71896.1 hypothetical protein ADS79_24440 [Brevibacillus reuszeri]MED1855270.1 hypothetical protein [Brevibacillus reuszeri]GED67579.1 hypothetical protein BRE01_12810 [Brevibacillus reuszeri]
MRIMLFNEILYDGPNISQITDIFNHAYTLIADKGLVYSHITIDGIEIYEDPLENLFTGRETVEIVEIKAISEEQFKENLLCSIEEYVTRAIPELERLSEKFYINPDTSAWNGISDLLEGIQWIENVAMFFANNGSSEKNDHMMQKFNISSEVKLLEGAVFQNDLVLVGDILKYEILPRFTDIEHAVGKVLKPKKEVENNVVN